MSRTPVFIIIYLVKRPLDRLPRGNSTHTVHITCDDTVAARSVQAWFKKLFCRRKIHLWATHCGALRNLASGKFKSYTQFMPAWLKGYTA